jgi:hypothetical protein
MKNALSCPQWQSREAGSCKGATPSDSYWLELAERGLAGLDSRNFEADIRSGMVPRQLSAHC